MKTKLLHTDFLWNGVSFDSNLELAEFIDKSYPELSDFIRQWFGNEGLIYMKTSGSTGAPKKIALKRAHMIHSAQATGSYFRLTSGSKALLCLPLNYIAGRMMLVRAMVLGWELDVIAASSAPEIPREKKYDFSAMVPLQLDRSIDSLRNIKKMIVGGAKVSEKLGRKLRFLDTEVFETYGMTETITHVAVRPLNKTAGLHNVKANFLALPNVRFSTDERGCLVIDARGVSDHLIVTNDVVELNSETSFEWLARFDNVINSGGLKLYPEKIEKELEHLIEDPFFVAGVADEVLGQKLVLLIEGKEQIELLELIKAYQKKYPKKISSKEIPRDIYFLSGFHRTESNKINRVTTLRSFFESN